MPPPTAAALVGRPGPQALRALSLPPPLFALYRMIWPLQVLARTPSYLWKSLVRSRLDDRPARA